ncbi:MAG: HAMP domain-containing sensor histidine kinase [Myxococcota bacterium]
MPRRSTGRLTYWVLSGAFLLIASFAVQQTMQLHQDIAEEEEKQAERMLQGTVTYWEQTVFRQARAWLDEASASQDVALAERRMRRTTPWFDALYVWSPGPGRPILHYPGRPVRADPALLDQHPCLKNAERAARYRQPLLTAAAYRSCRKIAAPFSLYSSQRAAVLLLQAGRPKDALAALEEVSVPLMMPLHEAAGHTLPLNLLVERRIRGAQAHGMMGLIEKQRELLMLTVREIAEMDAAQLEELLSYLQYTIPSELRRIGAADRLKEIRLVLDRIERRQVAYQEIVRRLASRPPLTDGELQIVYDPYGDDGFLLIYGAVGDERMAAVQVDPELLLAQLPATPGLSEPIILDAAGDPLNRTDISREDIWVEVAFGRLLSRLRLGLLEEEGHQHKHMLAFYAQIVPVMIALLLGGLALFAQFKADRRREELYQRQRDFIARVTHELKTPLAGIQLMAETLEMGFDDPEASTPFIERILSEVGRLSNRIDEVLRLTRAPGAPTKAPLAPIELVDDLIEEWTPRFSEVGVLLDTDLAEGLPPLTADGELLRDALSNLLSNALKYRHPERDSVCVVTLSRDRRAVIFEVIDNGLGVPVEMREAIFEQFTRVEGDGRGRSGGHGLGLSFVYETARAHDGSVRCTEGIDGGARFIMRIPY